ncbi:hypothetical protein BGZ94_007365 [Podila epigama]|nr:hypothetical protein BGZ94_007365 [Podila epigama]
MSLLRHTARRSLFVALAARPGPAVLSHKARLFSSSFVNGKQDDRSTNKLKDLHDKSVESLERNGEKLIDHLEGKARTLGTNTYKTQAFVTDKVHDIGDKGEDIVDQAKHRAEQAKDRVKDFGEKVEDHGKDAANAARKAARKAERELDEVQETISDQVKEGAHKVSDFVKETVESVKRTVGGKDK